MADGTGKP